MLLLSAWKMIKEDKRVYADITPPTPAASSLSPPFRACSQSFFISGTVHSAPLRCARGRSSAHWRSRARPHAPPRARSRASKLAVQRRLLPRALAPALYASKCAIIRPLRRIRPAAPSAWHGPRPGPALDRGRAGAGFVIGLRCYLRARDQRRAGDGLLRVAVVARLQIKRNMASDLSSISMGRGKPSAEGLPKAVASRGGRV